MIEFVKWVSIPVRVKAKLKRVDINDHIQQIMVIEEVEVCLDGDDTKLSETIEDLTDSILSNRYDEFVEDAWDNRY